MQDPSANVPAPGGSAASSASAPAAASAAPAAPAGDAPAAPDAAAQPAAPAAPMGTGQEGTEFKPTVGGPELQSGEKLLVSAYAVMWVLAFILLLFGWRRQRALDRRVTELEGLLARSRPREGSR